MIRKYYWLTKPGIIYGNAITATGGFLLASKGDFNLKLYLMMLMGLSLIIGSACVINNIFDKEIDAKMERTRHRATVTGSVSKRSAIVFASILLILGVIALLHHTNMWTLAVALLGFLVYVAIYTPLKPRSIHATLIGSVAGATPPVVGYLAISNNFDFVAALLFLILVLWQMPHFYAIAIYRLREYKQAQVPVLPAVKGTPKAKKLIVLYIFEFIVAMSLLTIYGYTGLWYIIIVGLVSLRWLWLGLKGFKTTDDYEWARKLFKFSLLVLLTFSIMISLEGVI